ncbi:MAG: hypothetical protein OXT68_09440 [Chloroflexota bacterium]|nr:hypothetical protein [Chloroflexota bacterium]
MKLRTSALVISAILLCAAALAVIAQDIDNCCFVDRQCSTDQEWTDGYQAFQNNQCPAPAQSQPVASSPTAGNAPAQIDNCCFVDRQCQTDQEWTDGYQAFQNNQCPASAVSGAPAPSQPVSGVLLRTATGVIIGYPSGGSILPSTEPSDRPPGQSIGYHYNCCEFAWQCNSEQDWAEGYSTLQNHGLCPLPGLISIVGDPDFFDYYERVLDLLKTRSPQLYDYVLNGLLKIEQRRFAHLWNSRRSYVDAVGRVFYVFWEDGEPIQSPSDFYEAAILVHEACHVHRLDAGLEPGELVGERACLTEQIAALEVISPGDPSLPELRDLLANIDNPEYQWWHD